MTQQIDTSYVVFAQLAADLADNENKDNWVEALAYLPEDDRFTTRKMRCSTVYDEMGVDVGPSSGISMATVEAMLEARADVQAEEWVSNFDFRKYFTWGCLAIACALLLYNIL